MLGSELHLESIKFGIYLYAKLQQVVAWLTLAKASHAALSR